ncbi:unnamed protein product [Adineta steineri]|uniref:ADP ribosyltransferase domain-containing protein n=1 Tax=Adineta steineri TaxID=433720 RepID=A0A815DRY5_9BILA|nr:unnamed protein product [Adineta steineri]CAF3847789.1 unnamed protein product [Adineta steineri]
MAEKSQKDGTTFEADCVSEMSALTTTDVVQENTADVALIWFDPTMNASDENEKIKDLLLINNFVRVYIDLDLCITYIKSEKEKKIFLIISGNDAFKLLPSITEPTQLDLIFIFPENQNEFNRLCEDYIKVAGIFDNYNELIKSIKDDMEYVNTQMEIISFYDQHQHGTRDLSDQSTDFLWFQLFNDVIKHLPHDDKAKEEMLTVCRQYYRGNYRILKDIDQFAQNYHIDECIQWYTKETFVYQLLNKALRTQDIEQLYIFRYYIADLSKELAQEYKKIKTKENKKIYLYRGTTMHTKELGKLRANVGKLIAANGYWSTSRDRLSALGFAYKLKPKSDMRALLFEIECDLHDSNDSVIFADISHLSYFPTEEELLFDAGSIFRIKEVRVEDSDTNLCVVQLITTGEGRNLIEKHIEQNRIEMKEESPRIMLGTLLKRMGKFEKSLQFLQHLLKNPGEENMGYIHNRIGIALKDQRKYDLALKHLKEAFRLTFYSKPPDRKYSAFVLHNQGLVYAKQQKYKEALNYYNRAVRILKEETDGSGSGIAQFYNSIGRIYLYQGDYDRALGYQLEALRIRENLNPDHVMNAFIYVDIANIYSRTKNYDEALKYHRRALELRQSVLLPTNHNIAWSLHQVGRMYYKKHVLQTALDYYKKSLEMTKKCFTPAQRHCVPGILMDIALVYNDSPIEAINYRLEALDVQKQTEPIDYSYLVHILDNIAFTYKSLGELGRSLMYYEEALQIRKENLYNDELRIADNHEHLGLLCEDMGNMDSASEHYLIAFGIYEHYYPYHHWLCRRTRKNIK